VPRLVKAFDEGKGWQPVPAPVSPYQPFLLKPETISVLHDGLSMAVASGTAVRARVAGREIAGKTGTSQVISIQGKQRARGSEKDLRDHGWFVFFSPVENPEIAGVVFAEHSEHGSQGAQIAQHIIATYYAQKDGLPLPVLNVPAPAPPKPAVPVRAAATVGGPGERH